MRGISAPAGLFKEHTGLKPQDPILPGGLVTLRKNKPICAVIQSGNIYISFQGLSVFICNFTTLLHHQS